MMRWSPWFDHNGDGCPCNGAYVRVRTACGREFESFAEIRETEPPINFWRWHTVPSPVEGLRIVQYQVRRNDNFMALFGRYIK